MNAAPSSCGHGRAVRLGLSRRRGDGTRKRRMGENWRCRACAISSMSREPPRLAKRCAVLGRDSRLSGRLRVPVGVETNGTHHRAQVRRSMRITRVVNPTSGKSGGTACRLATFAGNASCRLHIRLRTRPANGRARRRGADRDISCNRSMAPLEASRPCCKYPAGSVRRQKSS